MQRTLKYISKIMTALFLLAMLSCSTTEKVKQGYTINQQESSKVHLSKLAINQFFHQVQPVQKEIEKLYGLAVKLQKLHRHYPAIDTFKEILRQDPDNIKALNGVAVSFDLIGKHTMAAAYYQQALKVNPKLDYIWNNLGYCYFLQNQMDLSIEAYQKAITVNPGLQKYRNNLALVSAKQNQSPGSSKKATVKKAKTGQQIDILDLELVQESALKPLPIAPNSMEIESNDLGLVQASLPSDLQINPFAQEYKIHNEQKRKTKNRRHTEKIPFKSLPSVKSVKNITVIERPMISIQAKKSVEMETAVTISNVTKPIPNYLGSLKKISSGKLVSKPSPGENQIGPLKYLRMNTRLKKKRAEISSGRHVIIPRSIENQIDPRKHLQTNPRLKKKRTGKKIGLKGRTMVAKQTLGIQIYGLEVSNGNGIRHLARNVSKHLKNRGVQVNRVTNATHFQYPRTRLYCLKGLLIKARELARMIPGIRVVEVPAFDHDQVRIKLLLGKDVSSAGMLL